MCKCSCKTHFSIPNFLLILLYLQAVELKESISILLILILVLVSIGVVRCGYRCGVVYLQHYLHRICYPNTYPSILSFCYLYITVIFSFQEWVNCVSIVHLISQLRVKEHLEIGLKSANLVRSSLYLNLIEVLPKAPYSK